MITPPLDASQCPLCGRSNQCAVTAGSDPHGCWCMTAPVSPQALARIPSDLRDLACLCPGCAAQTAIAPAVMPKK